MPHMVDDQLLLVEMDTSTTESRSSLAMASAQTSPPHTATPPGVVKVPSAGAGGYGAPSLWGAESFRSPTLGHGGDGAHPYTPPGHFGTGYAEVPEEQAGHTHAEPYRQSTPSPRTNPPPGFASPHSSPVREMRPYSPISPAASDHSQHMYGGGPGSPAAPTGLPWHIEILNLASNTAQEEVEMHFESKRRSGGGHIAQINVAGSKAFILFEEEEGRLLF